MNGDRGAERNGGLHESNNSDNLDEREDEFSFTVALDTEQVDGDDEKPEERNPDGAVDGRLPVVDGDGSGDNFEWQDNQPLHSVVPAHSKTPSRVNEASRIGGERTSDGIEDGKLTESVHDAVKHSTDKSEGNKEGRGTTGAEGTAGTNEETSSYRTANGNHLQVTVLELSTQRRGGNGQLCPLDIVNLPIGTECTWSSNVVVGMSSESIDESAKSTQVLVGLGVSGVGTPNGRRRLFEVLFVAHVRIL